MDLPPALTDHGRMQRVKATHAAQESVRYSNISLFIPLHEENIGKMRQKCSVGEPAHWLAVYNFAAFSLRLGQKWKVHASLRDFLHDNWRSANTQTTHRQSFHLRTNIYMAASSPYCGSLGPRVTLITSTFWTISQRRGLHRESLLTDC